MLNSKGINELLSRNRDDRLCKRWYLMTPNGTLLAHSQPVDINDLRKQAAIAAICWQEHQRPHAAHGDDEADFAGEIREDVHVQQSPLHTLLIESEASNIIMRQIQDQLLLVLEGGVPPRRAAFVKSITAEGMNGVRLQLAQGQGAATNVTSSTAPDTNGSTVVANVLKLQRKKLDALADVILGDFQATGFQMPQSLVF